MICDPNSLFGNNGERGLPAFGSLVGEKYVRNNPPTINITGTGVGARFEVEWLTGAPNKKEEVAVFKVTDVGNEGQIRQLKILNRGLYETFPGDLNSGIPLEYLSLIHI